MRILFIHASWTLTPEYTIHRILAEHADPDKLDCYFIWQDPTYDRATNQPVQLSRPNRNFYWHFGRNMWITPKPSKTRRAWMMLWRLPGSLIFLAKKIKEIKPDLIYTSQQSFEIQFVRFLRRFFPIPYLIHINYPVGRWLGKATLRTILEAPHLLACSKFIEQGVIEAGVLPSNIDVVYNPTDFAGANLFCLPTENEAFGLVFVEAMVSGLPVAACSSGAVPEIVKHQETGLLSEPGDSVGLASNILTLLRDRELAKQMGAAGRKRALTEFAPANVAARWTEILYQRFGDAQQPGVVTPIDGRRIPT